MPSPHTTGSFRDPCGRVYIRDGTVYRTVLPPGAVAYQRLMQSGLYDALTQDGLLIPHDDLGPSSDHPDALTILRPERVAIISYPYEWCFSQLREAALTTLRVQKRALAFGCWLKDASAFNIQFHRGRAVLIDTLSLEPADPAPWPAYRQFCQHFYGPLLLAAHVDLGLVRLQQMYLDGPPLSLISTLLPRSTWLSAGPLMHIHLHAASARKWSTPAASGSASPAPRATRTRNTHALVESLDRAVAAVRWSSRSNWTSYYGESASYSPDAFTHKEQVVTAWIDRLRPSRVWDLGANTGHFSKIAARTGAQTVALDADAACVETLAQELRRSPAGDILPMVYDLATPTPAVGWANRERMTLQSRGPADLLLALALVHHLAIGNNVPFPELAEYLAGLGRHLIIEFVPKSDPMVVRMLSSRRDVFGDYDAGRFEQAFEARFTITERIPLAGSARTLYLMTAR